MKPGLIIVCLLMMASAGGGDKVTDIYRSPGKAVAPVELMAKAVYQGRIGETIDIPLTLDMLAGASEVRVQIKASDGLLLENGRREEYLGDVAAGRLEMGMLTVTSQADGRHLIGVTVFAVANGIERFRSFNIAVESTDVSRARSAKLAVTAKDENERPIHILPARDTY